MKKQEEDSFCFFFFCAQKIDPQSNGQTRHVVIYSRHYLCCAIAGCCRRCCVRSAGQTEISCLIFPLRFLAPILFFRLNSTIFKQNKKRSKGICREYYSKGMWVKCLLLIVSQEHISGCPSDHNFCCSFFSFFLIMMAVIVIVLKICDAEDQKQQQKTAIL